MFNITTIVIGFIFIFLLLRYLYLYFNYWKKQNVKQVNGVLWRFLSGKVSLPEIIKEIYDAHPKLPHVGIFLGINPTLILRDLQNIQHVFHGDFQSFYARGLVTSDADILTDNLFFIEEYKRWKLQKNKISSFFTIKQMKYMFASAERCAKDFVDYIKANPQMFDNDPYNAMYVYTTACINSAIFGIDKESQNSMETPINKIAYESLKPSLKFNLKFAFGNLSPTLYKLLKIKAFGDYETSFIKIVKEAIDNQIKNKDTSHNFIERCIKFQNEGVLRDFVTGYEADATLEFCAAQAFVFLIGGVDTIANVLHFTLLELSHNPNILQRLHEEIDETFMDSKENTSFEDIDKMEYVDMVINETLRKYPPVGVTQRKCCRDATLPDGIKLKKGTNILIPIYAIHRDSNYYRNPDVFDPERFSTENKSKLVKNTYIPFGGGKRICIGIHLASLLMKTCIVFLLHKYTLKKHSPLPKHFDRSFFGIRHQTTRYKIVSRTQE